MSLQDELIKIEVEIDSNSDRIADDFKNTSESASKMYGEIARLEKAMAFLKTTGKENSEQFKAFQGRLKEVKTELHSTEGKLAKLNDPLCCGSSIETIFIILFTGDVF